MHPTTKSIIFGILNATILSYAPSLVANTYFRFSGREGADLAMSGALALLALIVIALYDVIYLNKLLKDPKLKWYKSSGILVLTWILTTMTTMFIINITLGGINEGEDLYLYLNNAWINLEIILISFAMVGIYNFLKPRFAFVKKGETTND